MKKTFIKILGVAVTSVLFTSCLKDKKVDDQVYGTTNVSAYKVVEIPGTIGVAQIQNLEYSAVDTTFAVVTLNYAADGLAPEDIQVTLALNPTIIADYNTANGTSYNAIPSANYVLPNGLVATIKKGERFAKVMMKVNPVFVASGAYALGFQIASIDKPTYTISGNFNKAMVIVGVKNKYDGIYKLNGYHNRVPYNFPYTNVDMEMHTSGANSVRFFFNAAGAYGHPIGVGVGSLSWYGTAIGPNLTMNTTTNAIIDANNLGGATPISLDPTVTTHRVTWNTTANKPDKIYVTFRYLANQDRRFFDTLTFVKSR
jgi:hypothetical protein